MCGRCRHGQGVAGDRNIQNRISASFTGVLHVVLGVHVCAVLQQNIARSGTAVNSGEVKGCAVAADAVSNTRQNNIQPTPALQFNGISRGRLQAVSRAGTRWVHREMIGNEREVAAFSSFKNVDLACNSCGGGSLRKTRACDLRRRARGKNVTHTFSEAEAGADGGRGAA